MRQNVFFCVKLGGKSRRSENACVPCVDTLKYKSIRVNRGGITMQIEKLRGQGLDHFFEGILSLNNLEECYAFFDDVCTVNEIQSMAQRFQVAKMLHEGKTYSVIETETGASTATISRVKRSLNYGNDMYEVVFARMEQNNEK